MKRVHVAAGIILKNDSIFISKRNAEQHQGGKWEFPGGKVEDGETVLAALSRELKEEVNIAVLETSAFHQVSFDYPDKQVLLDFYLVTSFTGEEMGLEEQETAWVAIKDLAQYTFPAANQIIVEKLIKRFVESI